jgi:membrane protease YdiL (CAAX protease family)
MENRNRGWKKVLLFVLPYAFIVGIFQLIGMAIAGVDTQDMYYPYSSGQKLLVGAFDCMGTFLVLWIFMRFVHKEKFIHLGFSVKNRFREVILGIGIGALILGGGFLVLLAQNEIRWERILFDSHELLISLGLYLIVALVEETLFRGYVLRNLMVSFNKYLALVVSSILFAAMHGFNPNINLWGLLNLFLAGLLLGMPYIYSKNLWFPIAMHFSWNFFQTHLGFNVSGQDSYSIVEISIPEGNLFNGGAFGFEGSILAVVTQIVAIFLVWQYYLKKERSRTILPESLPANP